MKDELAINEAIKHCEEISNNCENINCGNEHKLLAEWLKDYLSILRAEEENRLIILPSRSDEIIRIVETALRIKLYDWQKAYILGESDYIAPGRRSGATTAYMVRLCISKGEGIELTTQKEVESYADELHGTQYLDIFKNNLWDIYYNLQRIGGLKLRKINFVKKKSRMHW